MSFIYICVTFSFLLFNLPKSFCQINGCFHETFDDSMSSGISSECASFNSVSPWTYDTYENPDVASPETPTSDGFIIAYEEGQHCVSNDDVLYAVYGSEMQVSYFATGAANIVVLLTNVVDKSLIYSEFVPIVYDDWTMHSFPLEAGDYTFSILGGVSNESSLIVIDSVTYVDTKEDLHYCMYGVDAPAPEPTSTPETTPEPTSPDTTEADTSAGTTPENYIEFTTEAPVVVQATNHERESESLTLALSLSIVFTILFALVIGTTCHCIQLRKEKKRPRY